MERLAKKLADIINEQDFCFTPNEFQIVQKAISHFKAYEDTGLEPEAADKMKNVMMGKAIAEIKEFNGIPIDHLCELVRAEQEGRLVVLPSPRVK